MFISYPQQSNLKIEYHANILRVIIERAICNGFISETEFKYWRLNFGTQKLVPELAIFGINWFPGKTICTHESNTLLCNVLVNKLSYNTF